MISPLKGIIPAQQTLTIEITFLPSAKITYTAQASLMIHQFDFQPLPISIVGTGIQKVVNSLSKRVKSSKLAPLKDEESKKTPNPPLRRKPSGEKNISTVINNAPLMQSNGFSSTLQNNSLGQNLGQTLKRTNIRTGYAKLTSAKRSIVPQQEPTKTLNPTKIAER